MLSEAIIRQYAHGARVSLEVAGQDIALHYALAMLNEHGLIGTPPGGGPHGPLLFKGGTALRKCVFGSLGRFSEDIDLDARSTCPTRDGSSSASRPCTDSIPTR